MNKIYLLSDIHFGLRNSSKEWLESHKDYFENFFLPLIEKEIKQPYLIIAGDVFDNRQSINHLIMDYAIVLFLKLSKLCKEIHIIAGNHDVFFKSSNAVTPLNFIKYLGSNITIYKEPELIEIDNIKFFMLPWINDKVKEIEIIKSQSKHSDYLICHTEVKDFYYNAKVAVKNGNDLSVYKDYNKVFSGHFHLKQNAKNLYYIGSPFHFTRADIGNKKGIYIFNTSNEGLLFIENNYSSEFKKIKIIDILNITLGELKKITKNHHIDLVADDEFVLRYNVNALMRELKEAKSVQMNVIESDRKINEVVADGNSKFNVIDLCSKYMSDNKFDKKEKEKITDYVENIYNKIAL